MRTFFRLVDDDSLLHDKWMPVPPREGDRVLIGLQVYRVRSVLWDVQDPKLEITIHVELLDGEDQELSS